MRKVCGVNQLENRYGGIDRNETQTRRIARNTARKCRSLASLSGMPYQRLRRGFVSATDSVSDAPPPLATVSAPAQRLYTCDCTTEIRNSGLQAGIGARAEALYLRPVARLHGQRSPCSHVSEPAQRLVFCDNRRQIAARILGCKRPVS